MPRCGEVLGFGAVMLGIEDIWVWLAYLLCILSTILCIVYGGICWNRGDEAVQPVDMIGPDAKRNLKIGC